MTIQYHLLPHLLKRLKKRSLPPLKKKLKSTLRLLKPSELKKLKPQLSNPSMLEQLPKLLNLLPKKTQELSLNSSRMLLKLLKNQLKIQKMNQLNTSNHQRIHTNQVKVLKTQHQRKKLLRNQQLLSQKLFKNSSKELRLLKKPVLQKKLLPKSLNKLLNKPPKKLQKLLKKLLMLLKMHRNLLTMPRKHMKTKSLS